MGSPQLARVSSKMRSGTAGWTMSRTSRYVQYVCSVEAVEDPLGPATRTACGILLLLFAAVSVLLGTYALVVSKLLPPTGVRLLDAVREDLYFCLLLPMMLPTTLIAVYANWVSMKFFKHA